MNLRPVFDRPTTKRVDLDWPFMLGDVRVDHVNIRHLTAGDVEDFLKRADAEGAETMRFPVVVDDEGLVVANEIMKALHDDDALRIEKESLDFLPRRFRTVPDDVSTPAPGGASSRK